MSEQNSKIICGSFMRAVVTRADGTVEDLGIHSYECDNPWKAILLTHNDKSKDAGLHEYWNQSKKHKAILHTRRFGRIFGIK